MAKKKSSETNGAVKFDFEINLDNEMYPAVWFGDTPGKRVCLRLAPPEKVEEFRKECIIKKPKQAALNPATRHMELVDDNDFDAEKFSDLALDFGIPEWDITDVNGKPIKCTLENKKLLMQMPKFQKFIQAGYTELATRIGVQEETEQKNSGTSHGE